MQVTLQADQRPKQKPQKHDSGSSSKRTIPIGERAWTDVEPGKHSLSDYRVSKKLIHLLRHGSLPRDNDGAIEFWRIKDHLQDHVVFLSSLVWRKVEERHGQEEEDTRKDFSIVLILQEQFCTSELSKVIQDAALLILHCRTMSLFRTVSSSTFITSDVQSMYVPSSIQDWYGEDKIWATDRQYSFCLWISWTKNTRILIRSTWMHHVLHNTCTTHGRNIKIRCIGSTPTLLWRKDWSSIRHDRTPSFFTKHSQLIVFRTLFGWKLERSYTRKYICHLDLRQRSPWNMTGWKHWSKKFPNQGQPDPNPDHDRTGRPVVCRDESHERSTAVCSEQESHPRFSREGQNLILKDEIYHNRTERPVVCRDTDHERSMLNEVDIGFRIPRLPHSVVKQADNYSGRELVKKIKNHPHRQPLQRDLQQNNAYNTFSATSKKMIQDMGNVELFELFETNPQKQCKECLLYWSQGIVYCTCGHLLKESAASRGVIQYTLNLLSNQNYVIKIMSSRRDLMAIDMGKLKNKDTFILPLVEKEMHQEAFSRDPRSFLETSWISWISTRTWSRWRGLYQDGRACAKKISPIIWRKQNTIDTKRIGEFLSIILEDPDQWGDRSDFNDALSTLNRLHQESGEIQLRPVPFWKSQYWHQSSSSSSSWWQLERFLAELIIIQRKSTNELMCKADMMGTGRPVVCRLWI